MMSVQIVEIAGQKMAMLPVADYERLIDLAEDKADIDAARGAELRRAHGEEYLPAEVVDHILDGESALRVWRKHRRMTLKQLAELVGISVGFLSDIENRKRRGSPAHWRSLSAALDVLIDDILPEA